MRIVSIEFNGDAQLPELGLVARVQVGEPPPNSPRKYRVSAAFLDAQAIGVVVHGNEVSHGAVFPLSACKRVLVDRDDLLAMFEPQTPKARSKVA